MVWKLIKFIVILAILAAIALLIYAYLGPIFMPADFDPPVRDMRVPVPLDLGS